MADWPELRNPVWHAIGRQEKMLIFRATKGQLLQDLHNGWGGCQNTTIYLYFFYLQKILKKVQLKKSDPTKTFVFVRAENALSRARQG